jgi:hypothetical protein
MKPLRILSIERESKHEILAALLSCYSVAYDKEGSLRDKRYLKYVRFGETDEEGLESSSC